jgi:CSLREA domain-containing protein
MATAAAAAPPVARAATFTVNRIGDASDLNLANSVCDTSTNAGNQCTLRAAIQEANDTPGFDTINFNITSTSKTITPATALPSITGRVTINGYSQPNTSINTLAVGNNATLRIILDGVNVPGFEEGLDLDASNSVIRGLVIQRFPGTAINVDGSGNSIRGNIIGTNPGGTVDRGNARGIVVNGATNTIGGTSAGARNLISGNDTGIQLTGLSPTGNVVAGNYIGTTKDGTGALGNSGIGVVVEHQTDCAIGTGTAGGGNVISANGSEAIRVSFSDGCTIRGNRIGTKADGTGDLGNAFGGVLLLSTQRAVIGGSAALERNTIAGNVAGIGLTDSEADIIGNSIVGNERSGLSFSGASAGLVQGNTVIANAAGGGNGLQAFDSSLLRITANQFIANGGLAINLAGGSENSFGVTANDAGDSDSGPNGRQNFPVITSAKRFTNGATVIGGSLNSTANTEFRIELFMATGAVDPSNHGEAQFLLAFQNITTNSSGNRSFSFTLGNLSVGQQVTATAINVATDATSELSLNHTIVTGP